MQPNRTAASSLPFLLLVGCAAEGDDSVAPDSVAPPADVDTAAPIDARLAPDEADLAELPEVDAADEADAADTAAIFLTPMGAEGPGTLDASPTSWSINSSKTTVPLANGSGLFADGSAVYIATGALKLRRPSGSIETIAKLGTDVSLIPGGPNFGAVYLVNKVATVAWRATNGTWSASSLRFTTTGGPATPSACVDSGGNGTIVLVNSTMTDLEGSLVIFPITNGVVGGGVVWGGDDEATAPSVVCSETGPDELVWRHQVAALNAQVWHASVVQGTLSGAAAVLENAYDPHYAAGEWVGFHDGAARTHLARSSDGGASFRSVYDLAEASHFADVATADGIVASLFATWPTAGQATNDTANQATRSAHLAVSLDDGVTWTRRDPWGTSTGYGPCNTVIVGGTAVVGACRSPTGVAGFSYTIR